MIDGFIVTVKYIANFFLLALFYLPQLWLVFGLCERVLGTKEERKQWFYPAILITFFIMSNMPHNTNEIKYVILLVICIWLFRGGLSQKACVITFGWVMVLHCVLFAEIWKNSYTFGRSDSSSLAWELVICCGGNLVNYAICEWIGEACREEDLEHDGWLFSAVIIANYVLFNYFVGLANSGMETESLGMWIVCVCLTMLVNIVLFAYYEKNILKRKQLKKMTEFQKKNELEQAHYQRLEEMQAEYRSLAHDMNRYLSILQTMKSEPENQGIPYELAEEIKARIQETSRKIYCERPVLNAILNEKQNIAKEHGIEFRIFIEPGFDIRSLDDFAMIGILSNLIDNAVEAASKRNDEKWVQVRMFAVNDGKQKFIRVENSKIFEVGKKTKGFITRKENKKQHGFGLKNVQKLVEENNGTMKLKAEGDLFVAEVMF